MCISGTYFFSHSGYEHEILHVHLTGFVEATNKRYFFRGARIGQGEPTGRCGRHARGADHIEIGA